MIIEALFKFAVERDLVPSDFENHSVEFVVDLAGDGSFLGLVAERRLVRAPKHGKRSGTRPQPFLLDKSTYTFGLGPKPETCEKQHQAFLELLQKLNETLKSQSVGAVLRFLKKKLPSTIVDVPWKGSEKVAFRVDGAFIYDTAATQALFQEQANSEAPTHICMVSEVPCVPAFQPRLKYLPGSQGATLVTFNSVTSRFQGRDAITSYPLSAKVQEGAVAAWNFLAEPQQDFGRRSALVHRKAVGHATEPQARPITGFWVNEPEVDITPILHLITGGPKDPKASEEERRAAFKQRMQEAKANLSGLESSDAWLHALTLQAFQGRAAAQDWTLIRTGDVARNLRRFFDLAFVGTVANMLRMLPSYESGILAMRAVLMGQPFPEGLVKQILRPNPCWPENHGRAPMPLLRAVQALQP